MSIYMDKLSPTQLEVVKNVQGPLMVLAGAGSGKTRTLVTKISYLLEEMKISPHRLLALTFSNKAAREMRERVAMDIDVDLGALQLTTFHAFCSRVLRSEATVLGLGRNFSIFDASESRSVVKGILGRRGISPKELSPYDILYYIEELKNNGHYPQREQTEEISLLIKEYDHQFYEYFLEYESELHRSNAIDFGGLIVGVLQLFEKFPEVLSRYQKRYQYLLVDEYQDTNRAQFELIRHLSEENKNICVVGDEDQSIYSWRGADIRNILDFEKHFENTQILKLEENYRSSRNIIEAASFVISRNEMRKGKEMFTRNPEGESIQIIECEGDKFEAEFIASEIATIVHQEKNYRDIAIFYRTNAQSRIIEDALRRSGIPYRIVGGPKFYERKEIKDLLSYLRLIVNPKDSLALSRIINVPARGIGVTTLRAFEQEAISLGISFWEVIEKISKVPEDFSHIRLTKKVRSSLSDFVDLLYEIWTLEKEGTLPSVLYEKILYESNYWEYLESAKDYESLARKENLKELASAIKQYEEDFEKPTLTGFLESITLDTYVEDSEENEISKGEVSLMTVHGAKGLEFPYVFLAGVEENVFPSFKSLEHGDQGIEEERRLFYVAMTRAMKKLFITFAQGRMLFGQLKFNGPSRFIQEIPPKYYDWIKKGKIRGRDEDFDDYSQDFSPSEDTVYVVDRKNLLRPKFPVGSQVAHSLYGRGKVLETKGFGNEEKVVIIFNDGQRKKFMVKFAPLTLL